MAAPDLNLLITLDVLLGENSVVRAAERLHLSPSAMSRALARLRETTGDPLLVRVGRGLVPTPRAIELRKQVGSIVESSLEALRPARTLDLKRLVRTFTIRTSDGFVENFGPRLIDRVCRDAPGVRLRFVQKQDRDSTPLREGTADLETGVVGDRTGQEIIVRPLFLDCFVGVVRMGHPLGAGVVTAAQYLNAKHVLVSRRGLEMGPIDAALKQGGLERHIAVVVGGFSAALALARASDLVASVPEKHTGNLRSGMTSFPLPVFAPDIALSLLWHPRMDADAAHRWLRGCVVETCSDARTQ